MGFLAQSSSSSLSLSLSLSACRYRYIEQPTVNLRCHPYDSGRLFTECAVTRGNGEEPINIEWVFQSADSVFSGFLSSSSMITITESFSTSLTQRSQLRVTSPNDESAGEYFCQIRFDNGTFAPASRALQLLPREVFDAQRLSPCSLTQAQSSSAEDCALQGFQSIGDGVPVNIGGDGGGGGGRNGGGGQSDGGLVVIGVIAGGVLLFIVITVVLAMSVVIILKCIFQRSYY